MLKQQGLEYKTWRAAMQQRRAKLDTAAGAQVRSCSVPGSLEQVQEALIPRTAQHRRPHSMAGTQHGNRPCAACAVAAAEVNAADVCLRLQGGDARRHGLSAAGVYQRTQGMYEVRLGSTSAATTAAAATADGKEGKQL